MRNYDFWCLFCLFGCTGSDASAVCCYRTREACMTTFKIKTKRPKFDISKLSHAIVPNDVAHNAFAKCCTHFEETKKSMMYVSRWFFKFLNLTAGLTCGDYRSLCAEVYYPLYTISWFCKSVMMDRRTVKKNECAENWKKRRISDLFSLFYPALYREFR